MKLILFVLMMGMAASIASFFLKKATANGLRIRSLVVNPYLYFGGGLYVLSSLLNLYLLRIWPYSLVVPLGALTYIWTLLLSCRFLGETVSKKKIMGILLILFGVYLLAR